jgi:hypothetical protein
MTYAVMTASAHMPSTCKGRYRKVAVVEYTGDRPPSRIDPRITGVRVVWQRVGCVGLTARCGYQKALREAEYVCANLTMLDDLHRDATARQEQAA